MKKFLTKLIAVTLAVVMTSPFMTFADNTYNPTVYFVPHTEYLSGDTITINKNDITDGLKINTDIFIDDETLTAWSIDLKFRTSSTYLTIENLVDPHDPLVEFAYAVKSDDGELIKPGKISIDCATIEDYTYFTCGCGLALSSAFVPYGEKSDDYALTSFDLMISPDTPAGEYQLYFITEPTEDIDYAHISKVALKGQAIEPPVAKNITIKIVDDSAKLGDINNDGLIDSNDATIVLSAYALSSTGFDNGLSDSEKYSADVNADGLIDANDASAILDYYSYVSTGGEMGFPDFLNK